MPRNDLNTGRRKNVGTLMRTVFRLARCLSFEGIFSFSERNAYVPWHTVCSTYFAYDQCKQTVACDQCLDGKNCYCDENWPLGYLYSTKLYGRDHYPIVQNVANVDRAVE